MPRSQLFEDFPGGCFGISSHDSHRDDRDNDDARKNMDGTNMDGTNMDGTNVGGTNMDSTNMDGTNMDDSNMTFDKGNPNLCMTCRKVNFKALFTSHDCLLEKRFDNSFEIKIPSNKLACRCEYGLEVPRNTPRCRFWIDDRVLPGKLDNQAAAYLFCAFLCQCQARLDLVPTGEDWYCEISTAHSLQSYSLQTSNDGIGNTPRYVQDVAVLQFSNCTPGGLITYRSQPILRVVDDGRKTLARDKRAGGGLLGRKLNPDAVDFGLIGEWLTLCRSTHSHCQDVGTDSIPGLVVIDCTTGYIVPFPPTENIASQEAAHYVTLSYLWGTATAFDGPVFRFSSGGDVGGLALPDDIPLVISDAIRVVEQLEYRYLWVDRYCIPQNDGAAKHIQILNMGRIYSRSSLTIIAAAGEGPEYGLPGVSSRARIAQLGVQVTDEISLLLYEAPKDYIEKSKWNSRGWTYQEGLLSKRRLVFTDLMVYFQCQETHGDEVLSLPIPGPGEDLGDIRAPSFKALGPSHNLWRVFPQTTDWNNSLTAWDRISEYGTRELGYDSDALNAISGVMGMYALVAGESAFKLFCGLPILHIRSWEKHGEEYWEYLFVDKCRACSFRNWFQDADPREGAMKAEEIDENNLTCSLAYSLSWEHYWDKDGDLAPASFEQARRPLFGSWTVAGWRTRKSCPRPITFFDSCLRISVQYSAEPLLDWEDDNARILDLSRNGKMPLSLNIRGLVMDVHVTWQSDPDFTTPGWLLTSPFKWHLDLFASPRWLFEEEGSGKRNGNGFLFLILGCKPFFSNENKGDYVQFSGMIIWPVKGRSNGQPGTFHEKLYSHQFKLRRNDWSQLGKVTREMEVRLI